VTGPEGQIIAVNPLAIVSTRTPRGHFSKGIKCLIHTADGKYISVIETCEFINKHLQQ
jgi:hypothetical protein